MRIALYIEDGLEQIVLTPESTTENALLERIHERQTSFEIKRGSFYECRGGWVRQSLGSASTMIVLRPASAIDARSDETRQGLGPQGESAVGDSRDAQDQAA